MRIVLWILFDRICANHSLIRTIPKLHILLTFCVIFWLEKIFYDFEGVHDILCEVFVDADSHTIAKVFGSIDDIANSILFRSLDQYFKIRADLSQERFICSQSVSSIKENFILVIYFTFKYILPILICY